MGKLFVSVIVYLGVFVPAVLVAQATPQVVTMKKGHQFIGEIASVTEYSSNAPSPWDAQPIALVSNGLKRILFNKDVRKIGNVAPLGENHPLSNPTEFQLDQRTFTGNSLGAGNLSFQPFNEFGHRVVYGVNDEGNFLFSQAITTITPFWCEVQTLADPKGVRLKDWTMRLATSSIPPNVIRNLLLSKISDRDNPAEYLPIVDFFRESQNYDAALRELAFIGQQFPGVSDIVEQQTTRIRQARARQWIRRVNETIDAGQPLLAQDMLRASDRGGIAGEILAELADLQNGLENNQKRIEAVRKSVNDLIQKMIANAQAEKLEPNQLPMLTRFAEELETDLNSENVDRLDAFSLFLADKSMTNLQKISLALSGWFLGSSNATRNFAISEAFFRIRDLTFEYLSTATRQRRAEIIEELKLYEGSEPRYLAGIIARMLPPKAPDLAAVNYVKEPLSFDFNVPGTNPNSEPLTFQYKVQLPPEYNPHRKYPCIFTLPGDKDIDRQITIWCGPYNEQLGIRVGQAMKNGYIVVAVDWKEPGQFEYRYSNREHQTILKALRQALQRFSIDTDRVFITGHGFGANAAYDIGIAHPEHWAGIIGISGSVAKYPELYRNHRHNNLPIYCVVGEKDFRSIRESQSTWNMWLRSKRFFDCTLVEYRGRSNEFFIEEIIDIFNWCGGQRRQLPDSDGFLFEGGLRRPWDNYYWFYQAHGIPLENVVWPEFFAPPFPRPFKAKAEIKPKNGPGNRILVSTSGTSATTLWLSPEFVDFSEEIIVGVKDFKDFVSPSRKIMLDDVRLRGDRQHPYWANLYFQRGKWAPNVPHQKRATGGDRGSRG